jgi:hypothetical protein
MSLQPDNLVYLRNAPEGLVLEFGVMAGRSIRMLAEVGRTVYGFDSFLGLPHDWGLGEARGTFACARPPEMPGNVVIIEGLFSDTLERFLGEHDGAVGFCHIDCDIYTSCAYVLDCLRDRWTAGSVIIFDDIRQAVLGEAVPGEARAWRKHQLGWRKVADEHSAGEVWRRDGSVAGQ